MSYDELGKTVAETGANGLDFPLRPKGHIEPEAAMDELPKLIDALKKHQQKVTILATGIQSVIRLLAPNAESILKAAKAHGIKKTTAWLITATT